MKEKSKHIPNILSFARIPLSLVMFVFAWFGNMYGFVICFVAAGLTDVFDGIIARKLNVQSELGEKIDSLADGVFLVMAIITAVFATEIYVPIYCFAIFAVLMVSRTVNMVFTWVKFRRVGFIHTRLTRWFAIPMFGLLLIAISMPDVYIGYPLAISLVLTTLAQLEETVILYAMQPDEYTMSLKSYPQWKRDREAIAAAKAARQQQEATV